MVATIVLPWLHYLGMILLGGGVVAEMYLLKLEPRADVVRLIARADRFYFIGVIVVLVSGLGRMGHGGKGMAYYMQNGLFHGVLTLFIIGALLSLVPTFRFIRWRKTLDAHGTLPDAAAWAGARKFLHPQMALLALISLLMVLIANGVGSTAAT